MQYPAQLSIVDAASRFQMQAVNVLTSVCRRFGLHGKGDAVDCHAAAVSAYYQEPWRHHHDIRHPVSMLELEEVIASIFKIATFPIDRLALQVMIIYHDTILKLMREKGWNERESAKLAFEVLLSLGAPLEFCHFVAMGIRATATHEIPEQFLFDEVAWNTVGLLLDLDLEGLGREEGYFARNTEANWREWQPVATRAEYDAGRAAWARNFLDTRQNIFSTRFFAMNEAQAKANLRRLAER